jgi:RimJ/RimL family protein N-acetyltransferase
MPHFMGKRIRLRAAEKSDIATFISWVNDPEVTENLMLTFPMSCYEEERWYENMMAQPPSEHVLVIEIVTQGPPKEWRPIGTCAFMNIDWRNRSGEVGIMIGEKTLWDQGYGTETMCLLIDHGFSTLNLHRIWLQVYAKNQRGIRAYEKAGFIHEGKFRQAHYQHGRYYDVHLMSVLKDEWQVIEQGEDKKIKDGQDSK